MFRIALRLRWHHIPNQETGERVRPYESEKKALEVIMRWNNQGRIWVYAPLEVKNLPYCQTCHNTGCSCNKCDTLLRGCCQSCKIADMISGVEDKTTCKN